MKDESEAHITVIRELGIFGLKTLLTPNGGAVVVLLAFLGNVVGADGIKYSCRCYGFPERRNRLPCRYFFKHGVGFFHILDSAL